MAAGSLPAANPAECASVSATSRIRPHSGLSIVGDPRQSYGADSDVPMAVLVRLRVKLARRATRPAPSSAFAPGPGRSGSSDVPATRRSPCPAGPPARCPGYRRLRGSLFTVADEGCEILHIVGHPRPIAALGQREGGRCRDAPADCRSPPVTAPRKQLAWDGTAVGRVRVEALRNLEPARYPLLSLRWSRSGSRCCGS